MFSRVLGAGLAAFVLLAVASAPSAAATIGVAINPTTGNAVGGSNIAADGTIKFFIPFIEQDEINDPLKKFGVSGGGMTYDESSTAKKGGLRMFLKFSPVTPGLNVLTLRFTDLDLFSPSNNVADPNGLLESVKIRDYATNTLIKNITSAADSTVIQANYDTQTIMLALTLATSPFVVELVFTATIDRSPGAWKNVKLRNTPEYLLADIHHVVPVPAALPLLASGLLSLGGFGWYRRRRAEKAAA